MVWVNFGKIQDLQSGTVNNILYITDPNTPSLRKTSTSTLYKLNTQNYNLNRVQSYSGNFKITFIQPPLSNSTQFFVTDDFNNRLSDKFTNSLINNNVLEIPFESIAISSYLYLKYITGEESIIIQKIDVTLPK